MDRRQYVITVSANVGHDYMRKFVQKIVDEAQPYVTGMSVQVLERKEKPVFDVMIPPET